MKTLTFSQATDGYRLNVNARVLSGLHVLLAYDSENAPVRFPNRTFTFTRNLCVRPLAALVRNGLRSHPARSGHLFAILTDLVVDPDPDGNP